jgi:hypothetical protein
MALTLATRAVTAPPGVTAVAPALPADLPGGLPAGSPTRPPVGAPADLGILSTTHRDALPLPTAFWGPAEAREALAEARLALPVTLRRPRLVSALTTVVLRAGQHAVKIYPPGTDAAHLDRIAEALHGTDTALLPVCAPVTTSFGVVSVSPWLSNPRPVGWADTGALLRRFHDAHADADVPAWDPLRRLVVLAVGLPDDAAAVLLDARAALLQALSGLHSPLGVGVVHGDVSPANVMRRPGGPVLIDLDFVARAPREYDLTSAARRFVAGEIDAVTYRDFCAAYGADVLPWDGRVVLDRIAELGAVAFRIWDDARRGAPLEWLDSAVREWRTPL